MEWPASNVVSPILSLHNIAIKHFCVTVSLSIFGRLRGVFMFNWPFLLPDLNKILI